MISNWDKFFLGMVNYVSTKSKDSTKVGAVLVDSIDNSFLNIGYNGCARGVKDKKERYERPAKYLWCSHGEQSLICNCAKKGIRTDNSTIYVNLHPCSSCSNSIVNAGIKRVVCPKPDFNKLEWIENFKVAVQILKEGKVMVNYVK